MSSTVSGEATRAPTVAITVNGERRTLDAGSSIAGLLASLSLDPRMIVVEHNRIILRDRADYPNIPLRDGDVIEIVHFVGGG
jgi:thiamine biosynthesis protein ThiS